MKLSTIVTIAAGVVGVVAGAIYLVSNKGEVVEAEATEATTEVETESTEAPVEA